MKFDPNWVPVLTALGGAVGGAGGLWAWLSEKEKAKGVAATASAGTPAQMTAAAADFQNFLNQHSESFIKDLRDDINDLRKKIAGLEDENQTCRQEANQLKQHVESLEAFLRKEGIPIPERRIERSFTVMEEGKTTVLQADPVRPSSPPEKRTRPRR